MSPDIHPVTGFPGYLSFYLFLEENDVQTNWFVSDNLDWNSYYGGLLA
jgi:hypothetical protein